MSASDVTVTVTLPAELAEKLREHWRDIAPAAATRYGPPALTAMIVAAALPEPPMPEPKLIGTVVMTDDRPFIRVKGDSHTPWYGYGYGFEDWMRLLELNPRLATPQELEELSS